MSEPLESRPEPDERAYKAAREQADKLQAFYTHLVVYLVVNFGLFLINLVTKGEGGNWWFYWPMLGWGIAVLVQAAVTFGSVFSSDWRDRKADELYERTRSEDRDEAGTGAR